MVESRKVVSAAGPNPRRATFEFSSGAIEGGVLPKF